MKQLIEDYERRLQTAETMLKEKDYSSITQAERIKTKASCYRTFIAELKQQCNIANVVESAELVACDEQGTPIIGEHGEKICNCAEPLQSLFPDNKYYCLHCWGEWYH